MFTDIDSIGNPNHSSIGVNSKIGKPMHLSVYNTDTLMMRETTMVPSKSWGGKGILGCKLSMGDEYAIPAPKSMTKKSGSTLKSLFGQAPLTRSKSNAITSPIGTHHTRAMAWKEKKKPNNEVELSALELNRGNNSYKPLARKIKGQSYSS